MTDLEDWRTAGQTVGNTLFRAASQWPDRDALIVGEQRATYAQLAEEVVLNARALIGLGVQRGDHVGILMPNCWSYIVLFYATVLIGARAITLNARYRADDLEYVVENADIRFLFIGGHALPHTDFHALLCEIHPELRSWNGGDKLRLSHAPKVAQIFSFADPRDTGWPDEKRFLARAEGVGAAQVRDAARAVAPAEVCLMMFSSGTTSRPKACMLSHRALELTGAALARRFEMGAHDRFWDPLPFFHMSTMLPLAACRAVGAAFIGSVRFIAEAALAEIEREGATIIYPSFPMIMSGLLNDPTFPTRDLSSIRVVNNVGPPDLLRRNAAAMPNAIHVNCYGLTEACGVTCWSALSDTPDQRAETSGRPFDGVEIRIVDPATGTDAPSGGRGEIWLRGYCLFEGYYKDPERTAQVMTKDGWLRSGDIGSLDEGGRVRYLGRLKDMLKIGGENVAAIEIESYLSTHPAVQHVQVIGVPDEYLIEVAAAFVELREGVELEAEQLVRYCIGKIASFKIPRYVRFVEEWPMSATKIQKYRLAEGFQLVGRIDPRALAPTTAGGKSDPP